MSSIFLNTNKRQNLREVDVVSCFGQNMHLASNRLVSDHLAWVHDFSDAVVYLCNSIVFVINWLMLHNSLLELVFCHECNKLSAERAKLAVIIKIGVFLFVFIL